MRQAGLKMQANMKLVEWPCLHPDVHQETNQFKWTLEISPRDRSNTQPELCHKLADSNQKDSGHGAAC